jgi:hypothetical protein
MPRDNDHLVGQLPEDELARLLKLTKRADSVELKLTVPDTRRQATVSALGMDPLDAQLRQVYFFDTPDLSLDGHGVVVRARRVQGRGDDTVIKLRPYVPGDAPGIDRLEKLVVEVDAMPSGYVCSASLKGKLGSTPVKEVVAGTRSISQLFSQQQRKLFKTKVSNLVALDDLVILGPITVLKLKVSHADFGRPLVAELWLYPDGSRILELSAKCAPALGFQVAAEMRAFLSSRGVDLSGEQQTKTRAALELFSKSLSET